MIYRVKSFSYLVVDACFSADGSVYNGAFKDGNFHGYGVFSWFDGDIYFGDWLEGRQCGFGHFLWADGRLYQGHYNSGKRDGEG